MSFSRTINSITKPFNFNSYSRNTILLFKPNFIYTATIRLGDGLRKFSTARNQDNEGFTFEDRVLQNNVWDRFTNMKLTGKHKIDNQTELFFNAIGIQQRNKFQSSTNQIIQFGINIGDYVTKMPSPPTRKIVGYDYSPTALAHLNAQGVETRCVNLNARDTDNHLSYQKQLENDFSVASDVLLIRILEYLNPEAVNLLLASMIHLAKPGTAFYIETNSPPKTLTDPSGQIRLLYSLKTGLIPTLFAGRSDFALKVLNNAKNPNDNENETLERFLIEKNTLRGNK